MSSRDRRIQTYRMVPGDVYMKRTGQYRVVAIDQLLVRISDRIVVDCLGRVSGVIQSLGDAIAFNLIGERNEWNTMDEPTRDRIREVCLRSVHEALKILRCLQDDVGDD